MTPVRGKERNFGKQRSLERKAARRERRGRFLVIVGGIRTERLYFEWLESQLRSTGLEIQLVAEGWNPARLLDLATNLRENDRREAKKRNDAANVYDEVWVVSDVDEFVSELRTVGRQANAADIKLAITNPCFESWLTMHVDASARPATRFDAQAKAKELGLVEGPDGKYPVIAKISGQFVEAERCAKALQKRHETNGTQFPNDTPSSGMHVLVRSLLDSARGSFPDASFAL